MSVEELKLEFVGYWRTIYVDRIPVRPGIFCVFSCTPYVSKNTVGLHELLYIGESNQVGKVIYGHRRWGNWVSQLNENQELCFSFAPVGTEFSDTFRESLKSVLVYENSPICNTPVNEIAHGQDLPDVIRTSGANWKLREYIETHSPQLKVG